MKKKIIFFICLVFLLLFFSVNISLAQSGSGSGGVVELDPPLGNITPQTLIGRVINAALGLVGSIALLMFIYGGLIWMTAAGSAEKVTKGKNVLIWAVIGLVVVFSAYALVNFVITAITDSA